ncbi:MAG TPA: CDP-alcohol phosphatidyltransferase family protein [Chthoniobacterales bacterium]|jgi:phosphatidylglycerophosphate synthase|nr:CDP-alcohol phosphatidyltransferase family protein [Chthoniobacterales bacterium]
MAEYEPTSRRRIGESFRATARFATSWCVRRNVNPDTISYASIVAAGIAALCFWRSYPHPWLLLVAPLFCYVRLWLNMLDGMVALASGKASWRGEILNDLPDRVSDVLIFAGVAHSGWLNPFCGYWAAICALLTAYVGMFGQAVGVHREFSGLMSKPWRMVALHMGAWAAAGLFWATGAVTMGGNLTILDLTCVIIVAGCMQTLVVRLTRIMAALQKKSANH